MCMGMCMCMCICVPAHRQHHAVLATQRRRAAGVGDAHPAPQLERRDLLLLTRRTAAAPAPSCCPLRRGGRARLVSDGAGRLAQRRRPDAARRRTRSRARRHGLFARDLLLRGREPWLLAQRDEVGGVDLATVPLGAVRPPQEHLDLSAPRDHRADLPLQRRRAAGVANLNPSAVGEHRHGRLLDPLTAAPLNAFAALGRLAIRLVISHVKRQTGRKERAEREITRRHAALHSGLFRQKVLGGGAFQRTKAGADQGRRAGAHGYSLSSNTRSTSPPTHQRT